jgi:hypothetical protein
MRMESRMRMAKIKGVQKLFIWLRQIFCIAPGPERSQSSYRSKLSGLCAIVFFVTALLEHCHGPSTRVGIPGLPLEPLARARS